MGMPDGTGRCPGVGGGTVRVSSRGVVSVVFLCVALLGIALSTPQIFRIGSSDLQDIEGVLGRPERPGGV